ncbi:MAG TPA: hypothetical protein VEL82_01260 [Thermoplasmata archaeon]|nr:hypothetical protein [Thermoplasmata archaeon]
MRTGGPFADWFPAPLVGVALLLGLLIVFTPFLTSYGQPSAGTIFSQAELIVDGLPGNATVHFYVRGLGTTTRYAEIHLGFAFGFSWTGGWPSGPLNWTNWTNGTNVLAITANVDQLPAAVNVSALYTANGASVLYVGLLAVTIGVPSGQSADALIVASDTSGIGAFSTPVTDLPVPITLANVGSGGGP